MHEKAAHAHFGKHTDLADQFLLIELAVPTPEGFATERGRRVFEVL